MEALRLGDADVARFWSVGWFLVTEGKAAGEG